MKSNKIMSIIFFFSKKFFFLLQKQNCKKTLTENLFLTRQLYWIKLKITIKIHMLLFYNSQYGANHISCSTTSKPKPRTEIFDVVNRRNTERQHWEETHCENTALSMVVGPQPSEFSLRYPPWVCKRSFAGGWEEKH